MKRMTRTGRRLGAVAFALATGALLAEVVAPETALLTVSPLRLAHWIRDARPGLDVIDTRQPAEYEAGHVPTARNVPAGGRRDEPIRGDGTIVLYGESAGDTKAVAGALSFEGTADVYVLERGIDGWLDEVMAPRLADDATGAERAAFAEQAELSRWFGGLPRIVPAATIEGSAAESSSARSGRLLGGC